MSTAITGEKLIEQIRTLAAENPRAVYLPEVGLARCSYTKGEAAGRPGCLIGQALADLGAPMRTLKAYDIKVVSSILSKLDIEVTLEQVEWLRTVQYSQDAKCNWQSAVYRADSRVEVR